LLRKRKSGSFLPKGIELSLTLLYKLISAKQDFKEDICQNNRDRVLQICISVFARNQANKRIRRIICTAVGVDECVDSSEVLILEVWAFI
jgi:hypothetical protein